MTRDHLQPLLDNATQKIVKGLDKVVCALNGGPTTSGIEGLDLIRYCDASGALTGFVAAIINEDRTGLTFLYFDQNLNPILIQPAGAPCTGSNKQVFQDCRCDDVNGDGSNIVKYVQFSTYDPATNTIVITGTWNEAHTAAYVPVNPVNCSTIGTQPLVVQQREHIVGANIWTRPANLIESVTIKVRHIGDILNPPTITDAAGRITPLFAGDVETYSVLGGGATSVQWLTGQYIVTQNAGDVITILYTQLQ